jgi:hypothetical protein
MQPGLDGDQMADWLLFLPVLWMTVIVFAFIYFLAAIVYWAVIRLAQGRATAFKGVSPGMLPPLGILFALLVGFISVEVWSNFDRAKVAVATEAGALRAVVLLAGAFPEEQRIRIDGLINRHIEDAVIYDWPAMAQQKASLSILPGPLTKVLHYTLALRLADDSQRAAQPEMVRALQSALEGRRQRIIVSEASVGWVKWAGIVFQGLCTLVAIAMVHSDNRPACVIALTLFATGIAVSIVLIAAYSRPFTGENSVGPDLLRQVIASEAAGRS